MKKLIFLISTLLVLLALTACTSSQGATGSRGSPGKDGNGIVSVVKTGTNGLVDTYTITFTDGTSTTFTVNNGEDGTNGNGIADISKTGTDGLVDTYTITYANGTTETFTITNGENGEDGTTPIFKCEDGKLFVSYDGGDNWEYLQEVLAGANGLSAYELYCQKFGYTGTEEEWLKELFANASRLDSEDIYAIAERAVVTIKCYDKNGNHTASGSGFFIDSNGTLATAHHVIDGAYAMKIETASGKEHDIKNVIAFDDARDIALLRADLDYENDFLETEKDGITPGEAAYSFGSSLGFLDGSFASGVVASPLRETLVEEGGEEYFLELQYTAPVSSGNSGGPILNSKGHVIGIVTWGYTIGNSLNFATYIEELDSLDTSYERSVSDYYLDTEYFYIKFLEENSNEAESNNSSSTANLIEDVGLTVYGTTRSGDYDYYKIVLEEDSNLSLAYYSTAINPKIALFESDGKTSVSLSWPTATYGENTTVYCSSVNLEAGTYYVVIAGSSPYSSEQYYIYSFWRSIDEFEGFEYDIYYEDMLS